MLIRRAEPLKGYNTLSLQACASAVAHVETGSELLEALDWARAEGLPVIPLGEGSNIVLAGDLDALVLCQNSTGLTLLEERDNSVLLHVEAGHDWHHLVQRTLEDGYYGLENLALIPGKVGAAPIQNIGAYGVEFDRFVRAVHAVTLDSGESLILNAAECRFGYRDSVFKQELRDQLVITAVDIELSREARPEVSYPALAQELEQCGAASASPRQVFDAVVSVRRRKLPDPAVEPNTGSFFKNPVVTAALAAELAASWPELPRYPQAGGWVKLPAAWLIEHSGWKGHCGEGVGVHPQHSLVLVNTGSDSGRTVLQLAAEITASVLEQFAVMLEIEPRIYGA